MINEAIKRKLLVARLIGDNENPYLDQLEDCSVCDGKNTVALIQDHTYSWGDISLDLPVFVCKECGDESLPAESFVEFFQAQIKESKSPYKRVVLDICDSDEESDEEESEGTHYKVISCSVN